MSGFLPSRLIIARYADADFVPLYEITADLQALAKPLQSTIEPICDTVSSLSAYGEGSNMGWTVTFRHGHKSIAARRVLMCTGGEPRALDIACPTLPLDVAFDPARLTRHLSPLDTVTVFGTAHSGALVARNIHNAGARVCLVHSGKRPDKPFLYARDGEYDGVKGEAADVCDGILAGKYPQLTLVSYMNGGAVANAVLRSRYVVYAIGFRPRLGVSVVHAPGQPTDNADARVYDARTGQIAGAPGVWGFGIGYPSSSEHNGTTYYDVGVPSFVDHLLGCWPAIVNFGV